MSNRSFSLSVVAIMVAASAFSAQERVIRVQNHLRFGYDDNIYVNSSQEESAYITDILNISGKLDFSSRSEAVFSYQPEVRHRFDADPKTLTYHDAYAKFNHAFSPRVRMALSDRFRYQQRDAQAGSVINRTDDNYMENDLMGSLDVDTTEKTHVIIGGGYEFRIWDDDNYGETLGNNFDHYTVSGSGFLRFNKNLTQGMVGADYQTYDYDGSRGSLDYVTLMTGADHTFNPDMTGYGRVGVSLATVDNASGSEDTSSPYLDAGMDFTLSEKTSLNAGLGYSVYRAENSLFNAQDRLNFSTGVRHDLTGKISVAGVFSYIMGWYDTDYSRIAGVSDVEDSYFKVSVRGSYQINRNNFVEVGYEYNDRSTDNDALLNEFDRSRVDIGWRLRL